MTFTLTTMGTASAMPISDRNPSAQMLQVHGRLFLIDCAEGTQQQMRRCHLSFLKVEAVFISHIHGDHVFGLFGLLNSMAMYGRTADLYIYGPEALGSVIKFYNSFFADGSQFKIVFCRVKCSGPELIHSSKWITVSAFPLKHKIECYGYRFDEILTPRRLAADPSAEPNSYAYCSDTMPFPELPGFLKGVRTLYHEATYMNEMADKAAARFHSTTIQAALCAWEAGVNHLIVGHYSSRITDFISYLAECKSVFEHTDAAKDLDVYDI